MNLHRNLGVAAAATIALGGIAGAPAYADAGAASASASVANNTLTIEGARGGDHITVAFQPADANKVVVDLGDGTAAQSFDRSTFTSVAVFLHAGDDTLRTLTAGTPDAPMTVSGGAGNDTILGGSANDTLVGGRGDDDLRGGAGVDVIFGNSGDDVVDGGTGNDTELLGGGADLALWTPGEASDAVDGGNGRDKLQFAGANVAEEMSLAANGSQAVLLRNVGSVRMDLDSVEGVDVTTLGGADRFTVGDLSGTDVRSAHVDLAASTGIGDRSVDTVVVNGTSEADHVTVRAQDAAVDLTGLDAETVVTGSEPTDHLQVDTLGGNDRVDVSAAAQALMDIAVDLGGGQRP